MSRKEVFTRVKSRLLYYADHQSQNQPQNQNSEPAGGKSQLGPGSRSRSGLVGNLKGKKILDACTVMLASLLSMQVREICYPFGLLVSWRDLKHVLSLAPDAGTRDLLPLSSAPLLLAAPLVHRVFFSSCHFPLLSPSGVFSQPLGSSSGAEKCVYHFADCPAGDRGNGT